MNRKYRIKKVTSGYGTYYVIETRLFGVLFWYNPDNIDGCFDGVYHSLNAAIDSYNKKIIKRTVEIIDI